MPGTGDYGIGKLQIVPHCLAARRKFDNGLLGGFPPVGARLVFPAQPLAAERLHNEHAFPCLSRKCDSGRLPAANVVVNDQVGIRLRFGSSCGIGFLVGAVMANQTERSRLSRAFQLLYTLG